MPHLLGQVCRYGGILHPTCLPQVAKVLDFNAANDGTFWMEFTEFCQYYKVGVQQLSV